jgi:hypothetical protein
MSLRPTRCKCRCCSEFFVPDYRNQDRQHYCSKPACRQASKKASQQRWRRQPANRDYFRGPDNVQRVQAWRRDHPGYWKRKAPVSAKGQAAAPQAFNPKQASCNATASALRTLQDYCLAEDPGFIGLLSMITGATLQEDIAATARRVVEQGRNILGLTRPAEKFSAYDLQAFAPGGPAAPDPAQL